MADHDISFGYQPGQEIGYDQITGNVNIASTTEATGTTIITCAEHLFDGAPVIAEFFSPMIITGTVSGMEVIISLFESSTQIGRFGICQTPAAAAAFFPWYSRYRFTPSAGRHTYTVTAFATNTTGTPSVQAGSGGTGAQMPAFVRFTKV